MQIIKNLINIYGKYYRSVKKEISFFFIKNKMQFVGNIFLKFIFQPIDGCNLEASSTSLTSLHRTGSVRKGNASKMISKVPDNVQLDLDEIRADLSANGFCILTVYLLFSQIYLYLYLYFHKNQ